jgi:hypothetical protein
MASGADAATYVLRHPEGFHSERAFDAPGSLMPIVPAAGSYSPPGGAVAAPRAEAVST